MSFLIGTDPELFVHNGKRFVSGFGMIEGTKEKPFKVEGGAVQVDGHALEFNIDPSENEEQFIQRIAGVRKQLQEMIGAGFQLNAAPVADFGLKYLMEQPEEANVLGCDPDFNAWMKGEANPRPDGNVSFRTGGGHVHIGWTNGVDIADPDHQEACQMLVRELDWRLGIPSLFWDKEDGRRVMYGKAGAYRAKPYGVEYRSLSNKWLSSEELQRFVYANTLKAAEDLVEGRSMAVKYGAVAAHCINHNDRDIAQDIIEELFPEFGLIGSIDELPKAA